MPYEVTAVLPDSLAEEVRLSSILIILSGMQSLCTLLLHCTLYTGCAEGLMPCGSCRMYVAVMQAGVEVGMYLSAVDFNFDPFTAEAAHGHMRSVGIGVWGMGYLEGAQLPA